KHHNNFFTSLTLMDFWRATFHHKVVHPST
ncbi:MAG: hypothetical protein ACI8RD_011561, partial [Bacillariaceae sp.]